MITKFTLAFLSAGLSITLTSAALAQATTPGNASAILARKQVPILCYHQIRDWKPTDKKVDKDYIIPIAAFKAHLKMLADSGYHTMIT